MPANPCICDSYFMQVGNPVLVTPLSEEIVQFTSKSKLLEHENIPKEQANISDALKLKLGYEDCGKHSNIYTYIILSFWEFLVNGIIQ